MAGRSRYSVTDAEAGIEEGILKNELGIEDRKQLDDAETILLSDAYETFFCRLKNEGLAFDLPLLFSIHKYFLEPLYPWAGKLRTVDISKDGVMFAPVRHLDRSVEEFENMLRKNVPSPTDSKKMTAHKLAVIHNEFNALHPFREGNGRTIRLFLDLLAGSVGYLPIDWSKTSPSTYFRACAKGLAQTHKPVVSIISRGLRKKK